MYLTCTMQYLKKWLHAQMVLMKETETSSSWAWAQDLWVLQRSKVAAIRFPSRKSCGQWATDAFWCRHNSMRFKLNFPSPRRMYELLFSIPRSCYVIKLHTSVFSSTRVNISLHTRAYISLHALNLPLPQRWKYSCRFQKTQNDRQIKCMEWNNIMRARWVIVVQRN